MLSLKLVYLAHLRHHGSGNIVFQMEHQGPAVKHESSRAYVDSKIYYRRRGEKDLSSHAYHEVSRSLYIIIYVCKFVGRWIERSFPAIVTSRSINYGAHVHTNTFVSGSSISTFFDVAYLCVKSNASHRSHSLNKIRGLDGNIGFAIVTALPT